MSAALDYLIAHQLDIHSLSAQVEERKRQTAKDYHTWVQESLAKARALKDHEAITTQEFQQRLCHPPNGGGHDHQFHTRR